VEAEEAEVEVEEWVTHSEIMVKMTLPTLQLMSPVLKISLISETWDIRSSFLEEHSRLLDLLKEPLTSFLETQIDSLKKRKPITNRKSLKLKEKKREVINLRLRRKKK